MNDDSLPPTTPIAPGGLPADGAAPASGQSPAALPENDAALRRREEWIAGGLAFLVFVVMLLCAGQAAVMIPQDFGRVDTRSRIKADYSLLPPQPIPAINPAILEVIAQNTPIPTEVQVLSVWETLQLPTVPSPTPSVTPSPRPTRTPRPTIALVVDTPAPPRPTATVPTPTNRPTRVRPTAIPQSTTGPGAPTLTATRAVPSATATLRRTAIPTRTHTPTITRTPTITFTPSNTPTITRTPTRTRIPTRTNTPTRTPTRTPTPSRTNTPVTPTIEDETPATTRTLVLVTTAVTPDATDTEIPTDEPTATLTPTRIATGEINEGTPDGSSLNIGCGTPVSIDFGDQTRVVTSLVYFEEYNTGCNGVCLDTVMLYLGDSSNPTDTSNLLIFNWGDTDRSNNGYIFPYHFPGESTPEPDNEEIPSAEMYSNTELVPSRQVGVCIRVPTPGAYRYLHIVAPADCGDYTQIDAFQLNIDLNFCPVPSPNP